MTAQRKYSDEFKADAVAKFREAKETGSKTIVELAKELGVSDALLHAWANKSKPKKAAKKGDHRLEQRTQYPVEFKQQAVAMVESGMSVAAVARQLKVSPTLVNYWHRKGIQRGAKGSTLPATIPPPEKAANGIGSGGEITDALIYLRHAEREILAMVRDGKIARPDQAHLLTLLALGALQKGINK